MAHLLNRQDAPFASQVWDYIDNVVINSAKSQYTARRVVDIEGPYGLGLKTVPTADRKTREKTSFRDVESSVTGSRGIPLAYMTGTFFLSSRDIASFESSGIAFDASIIAEAAIATAMQEDEILLNGSKELGTEGLLNAKGTLNYKLKSWTDVGKAAADIMAAVTALDKVGFHGPYALALAPELYNHLFRLYPQTHMTEFEHITQFVTEGVVKAASITDGGVLLATGRQLASIVLGQDIMAGFVGPTDGGYELSITESAALRILIPETICVLKSAS